MVAFDIVVLAVLWTPVAGVNDVVGLLAGGRALLAGVDLYDPERWTPFAAAVGQAPETKVFGYPPWAAVAFVPLALLPVPAASIVWTLGGAVVAVTLAVRLAPRLGWPRVPAVLLAGASWHAVLVLVQGQWGFALVALALVGIVALVEERDAVAGASWGAMALAKPQLFVLGSIALAAWALARHRPRIVVAALAVVLGGVVAGTLAAPGWIDPYVRYVLTVRVVRSTQQPTLAGLSGDVAGGLWPVAWVVAVVALGVAAAAAVRAAPAGLRQPLGLTAGLALSAAAAPYSWSYDGYMAIPLGAAIAGLAMDLSPRARRYALAALAVVFGPLAFLLWESAYVRWHDTLSGLVPPLAIVLALVVARGGRRSA